MANIFSSDIRKDADEDARCAYGNKAFFLQETRSEQEADGGGDERSGEEASQREEGPGSEGREGSSVRDRNERNKVGRVTEI